MVTGSLPERRGEKVYNTSFLLNREGNIVGKYSKMHLLSILPREDLIFTRGCETPVWDTEFGKLATMICYDVRFVELARSYALSGAEIISVVANFPNYKKMDHWRILLRARAIENQCYIIACNRVGSHYEDSYFGRSAIIDPFGRIIAEAYDDECILTGEIDVAKVHALRASMNVFADRQPQNYSKALSGLA